MFPPIVRYFVHVIIAWSLGIGGMLFAGAICGVAVSWLPVSKSITYPIALIICLCPFFFYVQKYAAPDQVPFWKSLLLWITFGAIAYGAVSLGEFFDGPFGLTIVLLSAFGLDKIYRHLKPRNGPTRDGAASAK